MTDRPTDLTTLPSFRQPRRSLLSARKFALIMRAYLPRPSLLTGEFHYPGIERLD